MPKIAFWLTPKQFVFENKCMDCLREWISNESDKVDTFKYNWYRCPICRKEMDKYYQPIKKEMSYHFFCPKCKGGCSERTIKDSVVYDCQNLEVCGDQISKEAIVTKREDVKQNDPIM